MHANDVFLLCMAYILCKYSDLYHQTGLLGWLHELDCQYKLKDTQGNGNLGSMGFSQLWYTLIASAAVDWYDLRVPRFILCMPSPSTARPTELDEKKLRMGIATHIYRTTAIVYISR